MIIKNIAREALKTKCFLFALTIMMTINLIIKITIFSIVIGLKKLLFSTNSLAKLLSDSLLLDSGLLSDSSISQSRSKL